LKKSNTEMIKAVASVDKQVALSEIRLHSERAWSLTEHGCSAACGTRKRTRNLLVAQFLEHLPHLVEFDWPLVLSLIPAENVNLPARDLVALDRALLSMVSAHIADEGFCDLEW
jgi:hypothetical protein